ncbi:hypothetical protein [Algoriphagus aquimarinus]|uniref:hypothetical protein n=1 Tax=Algoriphagus aquimarinus TaxID=237018 RepID=UPI0030DB1815
METYLAFFTTVFSGFSLFLVWRGYELARSYIQQHQEKVIIERNLQWTEKIIETYFNIEMLGHDVFSKLSFYLVLNKMYSVDTSVVPMELRESLVKLELIYNEYEPRKGEFISLFSSIAVPVDFLKDEVAVEMHKKTIKNFINIFSAIKGSLDEIKGLTNSSIDHLGREEKNDFLNEKRIKLAKGIPSSFTDLKNKKVKKYHIQVKELKEYLMGKYIP